jgi:hypothetical protein
MSDRDSKALPLFGDTLPKTGGFGNLNNEDRDPRFAELDAQITAEDGRNEQASTKSGRRATRRRKRMRPTGALNAEIRSIAAGLIAKYPARINRSPKAFKKRILALLSNHLPPYPKPSGRKRLKPITRASELHERQRREVHEGKRDKVNWLPIAKQCIPGFANIRSDARRQCEIRRLQDAVHKRERRKAEKIRKTRKSRGANRSTALSSGGLKSQNPPARSTKRNIQVRSGGGSQASRGRPPDDRLQTSQDDYWNECTNDDGKRSSPRRNQARIAARLSSVSECFS